MTLVLNNQEIEQLLPIDAAIDALEPAYCDLARGEAISACRRDLLTLLPGAPKCVYEFKDMPAVYPRKKIAVLRINSDFLTWAMRAGNLRREKDPRAPGGRFVGLIFLFSMETGELIAILPDGEIQRIRVGAANGLAAKYLARADAATLGLLGSGFQAGAQLRAMRAVRPIRRIRVYSPNQGHCRAFAREWTEKLGQPVEPVASGREAAEEADIVVAATNSAQPVFEKEWLRPGMFVTSIRAFEFDRPTLERCDVLVVHSRESEPQSVVAGGDLTIVPELASGGAKPKGGMIDWGQQPDLGELLLGKTPARANPDQITCFVNQIGMSLQFAACGAVVYERARQHGVGRDIPNDWFTEAEHP
jgi:alanine dehydrogenase